MRSSLSMAMFTSSTLLSLGVSAASGSVILIWEAMSKVAETMKNSRSRNTTSISGVMSTLRSFLRLGRRFMSGVLRLRFLFALTVQDFHEFQGLLLHGNPQFVHAALKIT